LRLLILLLLCGQARAEDPVAASRDHYTRGRALYQENRNAEALREFEAGFELAPRPEFLINMGLCQARLGHLREARDQYRKFLAATPQSHPQRQNVQELLDKVEADLATQPSPAPASTPAPTAPKSTTQATTLAAPSVTATAKKSFARRNWWIFPVVGVVVAGVAVGLGVGLSHRGPCDGKGLCVDASQ
jgi:tetratricopeptide (TPR) repeat protein